MPAEPTSGIYIASPEGDTGKSTIADGKIEGDAITFSIKAKFQDNDVTLTYKGKVVSKDELKLSSEIGGSGQTIDWTVKRAN